MNAFRFGPFLLDVEGYELRENGATVALPRLAMELLLLLVRSRGRMLGREEIARAIWPHADPEDVTQSINTAVNRIRLALKDDPVRPAYVQTVIGKGYRFIGRAVAEADPAAGAAALVDAPADGGGPISLEKLHAWYVAGAPIEISALRVDGGTTVLTMRGGLRLGPGLKMAEMEVEAEIARGVRVLVLDLSGVPFADSAGLGMLLHVFGRMGEQGGSLRLCGVTERVLALLKMTRTDGVFAIDADLRGSLAATGRG